jgi:hypothetical protein
MAGILDILWKVTIYEKLMSIAIFAHFPPPESTFDLPTVFPPQKVPSASHDLLDKIF